jgi:hypothetical protein
MEAWEEAGPPKSAEIRHSDGPGPVLVSAGIYKQCPLEWYLPLARAVAAYHAVAFAAARQRHWRSVTINLNLLKSPQIAGKVMRALTDNIRHWQPRKGCSPYYIWLREFGGEHGDHVHLLVAIEPGTGRKFSWTLQRWLRLPSIQGRLPAKTLHSEDTDPFDWLKYCLKTLTPNDRAALHRETGLLCKVGTPGGLVRGQQVGMARALQQKARMKAATAPVGSIAGTGRG